MTHTAAAASAAHLAALEAYLAAPRRTPESRAALAALEAARAAYLRAIANRAA